MGLVEGCEAVVAALKAFGTSDKDVARVGCAAVRILVFDADNRKRLKSAGGLDVVNNSMDNEYRARAIEEMT